MSFAALNRAFQNGFRIGELHHVDPSLNSVSGPTGTTRLEPKAMHVLVCLVEQAGHVVAKEQLMRTVWPETFVTDDVLTRCISELRRVFGDDPKDAARHPDDPQKRLSADCCCELQRLAAAHSCDRRGCSPTLLEVAQVGGGSGCCHPGRARDSGVGGFWHASVASHDRSDPNRATDQPPGPTESADVFTRRQSGCVRLGR